MKLLEYSLTALLTNIKITQLLINVFSRPRSPPAPASPQGWGDWRGGGGGSARLPGSGGPWWLPGSGGRDRGRCCQRPRGLRADGLLLTRVHGTGCDCEILICDIVMVMLLTKCLFQLNIESQATTNECFLYFVFLYYTVVQALQREYIHLFLWTSCRIKM